jgi:predicted Zn-dependent protease
MTFFKAIAVALLTFLTACGTTTKPGAIGITRQQLLIVPASTVERMALTHYADQQSKARNEGRLIDAGPEYERLKAVGKRLIPQTSVFRDDIRNWKWHLTLIDAPTLNASCAPGGKITFYTGIIRQLELTDDEIAAIMGHEIAHAIREHGREKVSEAMGQQILVSLLAAKSSSPQAAAALANQVATVLYRLPNSREKETEADRIGLELMARAGYDPSAAISLWKKMADATQGRSSPEFLSTHPSHASRMADLQSLQPLGRHLYEASSREPAGDSDQSTSLSK